MQSSIKIKKIETGYGIKFPFELKDLFKASFKSAKWNPIDKQWEVGSRSGARLEQWAIEVTELASKTEQYNNQHDEAELKQDEIAALKNQLENELVNLNRKLETLNEIKETFTDSLEAIAKLKQQVATASAEVKNATEIVIKQKEEIKERINGIINIDTVMKARQQMIFVYKQVGATARGRYDEAQSVIKEAIENLANAKLKSYGLNKLYYMNFNRPDRDNPNSVEIEDIYTIEEIE